MSTRAPAAYAAHRREFLTQLHTTLNATTHRIHRLLCFTADSPDLLAIIKQEGLL